MDFTTKIMLGVLFGAFGSGYFVYGRKQSNVVALLSGVALCIFPYFVSNGLLILLFGAIFLVLPFVLKLG
jgi:hypothetical protein